MTSRSAAAGGVHHPALRVAAALIALSGGLALLFIARGPAAATAVDEEVTVVRHVLTIASDGTVAVEQEEIYTGVSAAFKVNSSRWPASSIPVAVAFNPSGAPGGIATAQVIQDAIAKWNAVPSAFAFTWGGTTTNGTGSCADGPNFVTDGTNTVRFANLPGLTLGITCTIFAGGKIKEFDMELDGDGTWSSSTPPAPGAYDLPTTVLHELGHALGLGHSCGDAGAPACSSVYLKSVMYGQIAAGESRRELTADDIAGLQSAYPPATTPTATATATLPPLGNRVRTPLLARD